MLKSTNSWVFFPQEVPAFASLFPPSGIMHRAWWGKTKFVYCIKISMKTFLPCSWWSEKFFLVFVMMLCVLVEREEKLWSWDERNKNAKTKKKHFVLREKCSLYSCVTEKALREHFQFLPVKVALKGLSTEGEFTHHANLRTPAKLQSTPPISCQKMFSHNFCFIFQLFRCLASFSTSHSRRQTKVQQTYIPESEKLSFPHDDDDKEEKLSLSEFSLLRPAHTERNKT